MHVWVYFGCGNTARVCEYVHTECVCIMTCDDHTLSLSSILDCKASLLFPKPPTLHHHRYSFLLPQHKQTFWDPWQQFPSPRQCLNGVVGNLREVSVPQVTHITVSLKQYSGKQSCRPMQLWWLQGKQTADTEWACAPLRTTDGTYPFKIYFSQFAGAELSRLAWAEPRRAAPVW